mmetsp:Transcript_17671/g.51432  ORF Transcript_17671/g.51432 Transcript_17671/m.51432 type:complete len:293 (-) Transcript_17671:563-1441(-)|eukprot:CAMPEP_0113526108 /NCGR_PEP_ID=MMETSP0015_2-20120614/559_1 /TAXON_ID=2838 /ORGANISM="Odontella" /LENGTH=292 /DNA_ID=CAMNT_0000424399 /DNA_START=84 /DNA_END=962 /DNA_ORIENTATION=+ /assembly_acc=CAM_ASM_000160
MTRCQTVLLLWASFASRRPILFSARALSTPSPSSNLPPELLSALRSRPAEAASRKDATTNEDDADGGDGRVVLLRSLLTPADRSRAADAPDEYFYDAPMMTQHNDDRFRAELSSLYASVLPPDGGGTFLDLGSSWVSHLPDDPQPARVWLHGMNAEELERNPAGNGWRIARSFNDDVVRVGADSADADLLASEGRGEEEIFDASSPPLPRLLPEIPPDSVDVVGICAAFQYWRFPERVAAEILRVLKPGGTVVVSFSNRMFSSKAVGAWTRRNDAERIEYVAEVLERGAALT